MTLGARRKTHIVLLANGQDPDASSAGLAFDEDEAREEDAADSGRANAAASNVGETFPSSLSPGALVRVSVTGAELSGGLGILTTEGVDEVVRASFPLATQVVWGEGTVFFSLPRAAVAVGAAVLLARGDTASSPDSGEASASDDDGATGGSPPPAAFSLAALVDGTFGDIVVCKLKTSRKKAFELLEISGFDPRTENLESLAGRVFEAGGRRQLRHLHLADVAVAVVRPLPCFVALFQLLPPSIAGELVRTFADATKLEVPIADGASKLAPERVLGVVLTSKDAIAAEVEAATVLALRVARLKLDDSTIRGAVAAAIAALVAARDSRKRQWLTAVDFACAEACDDDRDNAAIELLAAKRRKVRTPGSDVQQGRSELLYRILTTSENAEGVVFRADWHDCPRLTVEQPHGSFGHAGVEKDVFNLLVGLFEDKGLDSYLDELAERYAASKGFEVGMIGLAAGGVNEIISTDAAVCYRSRKLGQRHHSKATGKVCEAGPFAGENDSFCVMYVNTNTNDHYPEMDEHWYGAGRDPATLMKETREMHVLGSFQDPGGNWDGQADARFISGKATTHTMDWSAGLSYEGEAPKAHLRDFGVRAKALGFADRVQRVYGTLHADGRAASNYLSLVLQHAANIIGVGPKHLDYVKKTFGVDLDRSTFPCLAPMGKWRVKRLERWLRAAKQLHKIFHAGSFERVVLLYKDFLRRGRYIGEMIVLLFGPKALGVSIRHVLNHSASGIYRIICAGMTPRWATSNETITLELVGCAAIKGTGLVDFAEAASKTFTVVIQFTPQHKSAFKAAWATVLQCDVRVNGRNGKTYARFNEGGATRRGAATTPKVQNMTSEKIFAFFCADASKWGKLPPVVDVAVFDELKAKEDKIKTRFNGSETMPLSYQCATCDGVVIRGLDGSARVGGVLHWECKLGRQTEPATLSAADAAANVGWTPVFDLAVIVAVEKMESRHGEASTGGVRRISSALSLAGAALDREKEHV
ncbi:hypothetical protein M885DRAFT_589641 [Pelagophyceae sp. CCMP2097]|nr:hypothetical protein M885DRAFT_589641 [Pelagophyceae sp. CCMP2097]